MIDLGKDMKYFYRTIWSDSSMIDELIRPPRIRGGVNLDFHSLFWSIAWARPWTIVIDELDGVCDD